MDQCCMGLVIDDDPAVLQLVQSLLTRCGYPVHCACGGEHALEVFRADPRRICYVLTDVQMPGLDGPSTVAEMRRLCPDLPCGFMSGALGDYSPEDLRNHGGRSFLKKPFTLHQLLAAISPLMALAHTEAYPSRASASLENPPTHQPLFSAGGDLPPQADHDCRQVGSSCPPT
jgi:CheY-like chemotaxis protein